MTSKLNLSFVDFDDEVSSASIRGNDITAGNFTAQAALLDAIAAAIDGVTVGTMFKDQRILSEVLTPKTLPALAWAQRETKWLVRYTDNVDPIGDGSFEIPTADLTLLLTGTKNMNIAAGAGLALVTALAAGMPSRLGNPITIVDIIHVGRNI